MDPELIERLGAHGRWLDDKAAPLPLDARVPTSAGPIPEPGQILDPAPVGGRPPRARRLAVLAAAILVAAALAGIAVISRSRDRSVGTPALTTAGGRVTAPSTGVTSTPVPASTTQPTPSAADATAATEPPTLSTTSSKAPLTADGRLRGALAGLWGKSFPEITDATGPFPGPDGYFLSFISGGAAPLIVVTPCGTSVSSRYDVVDGHLVIGEWIAEPGGPCPSATERKRIGSLKARLAAGPSVVLQGDQLTIGDQSGFTKAEPLTIGPFERPATMDALQGRTFAGLGPGPAGAPSALLHFDAGLELRTACEDVLLDAVLVDGQLRTTIRSRVSTSDSSCDDSGVLAFVVSWPRLLIDGSTLRVVSDSLGSQAVEVTENGSPIPGRTPAPQTSTTD